MEGDGEGSFGWGWGEGAIACADVSILPPPNLTSSRIESAPKVLSKTLKTDGMASMNLQQMFFSLIPAWKRDRTPENLKFQFNGPDMS